MISNHDKSSNSNIMNFNGKIKMTEKTLKSINKLTSDPNYHCDTLLFQHVISYDKCVDVMGLNKKNTSFTYS